MLGKIKNFFVDEIAIDLGTANTLIYQKNKGIILNEPSVVAMTQDEEQILAIGSEAKAMLGRTPATIKTIRPLKDGVIANFQAAEKMLQGFVKSVYASRLIKPYSNILICVPCNSNQVDCRAIKESALRAGARKVMLISEPVAAAIGVGMNIGEANGCMIVDIGGGTMEIAVLSLNGMVYSSSVKIGGDRCDESIINYLKKKFNILIGEVTAEFVKMEIGCAYIEDEKTPLKTMQIRGINLITGMPISITITNRDLKAALHEPLQQMLKALELAINSIPPELLSDIIMQDMVLTGGGALLAGLDRLFAKALQIPVIVAEDPLTCVARGGGRILEVLEISEQIRMGLLQV